MTDALLGVIALCTAAGHSALGAGGWLGMMALGAAGSLAHCGPMCGPIVAGQVADRLACVAAHRLSETQRLRAGLLLPYHAGRLSTYAALGALAGGAGFALIRQTNMLRAPLLLLAAALLLATAWRLHPRLGRTPPLPRRLLRVARRVDRTRPAGAYAFGLVMGLLPCGLLYAALVGASAAGTPLGGAAAMVAFGVGTAPLLMGIGVGGRALGGVLGRAAPYLLSANAVVLGVKAFVLF